MTYYVTIWGLGSLAAAIIAAIIAAFKRRDASAWAFGCFVFPPALIVLILLGKNFGPMRRRRSDDDDDDLYRDLARD